MRFEATLPVDLTGRDGEADRRLAALDDGRRGFRARGLAPGVDVVEVSLAYSAERRSAAAHVD